MGKHQSGRSQVIGGGTPDRAVGSLGHLGYLTALAGLAEKAVLCAITARYMAITAGVGWGSL